MTYNYNKEQHTAKIKAGLKTAKKKSKKLGRPKGGKVKGEDEVLDLYKNGYSGHNCDGDEYYIPPHHITYDDIGNITLLSKSTVQKIINKYKKRFEEKGSKDIPPRKFMTVDRGGKSYTVKALWHKSNKEPKLELKAAIIIDDPLNK